MSYASVPYSASRKVDDISRHESKHNSDPKQDPKHNQKHQPDHDSRPKATPGPAEKIEPRTGTVHTGNILL
jgi:hypothetical protein